MRQQIREWQGSQWLDGLVASLGAAAVVTALLMTPVMDAATGSGADVAVNLAYPAADLLLLMLIVTVFAVTGWRPGRRWWLLGIGMALFAVADVVYLVQLGVGSFQPGTWLDDVWLVGVVAMALASWVSSGRTVAAESHGGLRLLAVPMLFAASSLAVLAAQALQPSRGSLTVTILCVTTIMVALLRTSLSFREVRALADAQRLARTDDLTGLPNRRQLLAQIDCVMSARGSAAQAAVLLIDLDRFKEVNDSFGHHVGDNLLRLISNRLEQAMPGGAMLARMGGDEFGVLLPSTDEAAAVQVAQEVSRQLAVPFALQGLRLHVEASAGIALCPRPRHQLLSAAPARRCRDVRGEGGPASPTSCSSRPSTAGPGGGSDRRAVPCRPRPRGARPALPAAARPAERRRSGFRVPAALAAS